MLNGFYFPKVRVPTHTGKLREVFPVREFYKNLLESQGILVQSGKIQSENIEKI